jgi:hypothetical protein
MGNGKISVNLLHHEELVVPRFPNPIGISGPETGLFGMRNCWKTGTNKLMKLISVFLFPELIWNPKSFKIANITFSHSEATVRGLPLTSPILFVVKKEDVGIDDPPDTPIDPRKDNV